MMNAVCYHRCSTDEQEQSGLGLTAQRLATASLVQFRGFETVATFEDALSGKSADRPGLQSALAMLASRNADVLVVAKLDRLARSTIDLLTFLDMSRKQGWDLAIKDLDIDTTTANGRFAFTIMAAVAELERRMIGQRTSDALQAKKRAGAILGPSAWQSRGGCIPEGTVQYIRSLRSGGMSLPQIARRLNDEGYPTARKGSAWRPSSLQCALRQREVINL